MKLARELAQFYADPLGFVHFAYKWGWKGTPLENEPGPDSIQADILRDLGREVQRRGFDGSGPVAPIRMAVSSGHDTGKSVLGAWIGDWILSTRPHSMGTVTANTNQQLRERTWAALRYWTKLSITSHWFEILDRVVRHREYPESWKIIAQTCKEENSQAFAGQHAKNSTSWYLFDEASNIPDGVWEVAYGGLKDGEPMFFCWGQATRNSGEFHRICFGSKRERWIHRTIDSRQSRFTNKKEIAEEIADYGEDSDYVRVRIKGLPPNADELQFIGNDRIREAQRRAVEPLLRDPLVAGFDVSGGGAAWNVFRFRRGLDARTIPPIRITGEQGRNREVLIAKAAEILSETRPDRKVAMMFVDASYGAPIVERLHVLGFQNVVEVNFGAPSPNHLQANMRAYMWNEMKEWLPRGAIPADDERLEMDLGAPGYQWLPSGKLVIEPKEKMARRGVASPDDGDALALTFAQRVAPVEPERSFSSGRSRYAGPNAWMGM